MPEDAPGSQAALTDPSKKDQHSRAPPFSLALEIERGTFYKLGKSDALLLSYIPSPQVSWSEKGLRFLHLEQIPRRCLGWISTVRRLKRNYSKQGSK